MNGGNGAAGGTGSLGDAELAAELVELLALLGVAVLLLCLLLVLMTVITTAAMTATRRDHATGDEEDPARPGLFCAALQLAFEFALGCRSSLFVGRHGRYASRS